jgi:hypothetical protein
VRWVAVRHAVDHVHLVVVTLARADVQIRFRRSTIRPDEVTGYAVTLPSHTADDGSPIWYGGARLHDTLTLRRCTATDPNSGADEAWATADTEAAHQAAGELRNAVAEARASAAHPAHAQACSARARPARPPARAAADLAAFDIPVPLAEALRDFTPPSTASKPPTAHTSPVASRQTCPLTVRLRRRRSRLTDRPGA